MFEFTTWHASFPVFLISVRHYTVIGKRLLISNGRNRVRWVILGLLQDGACTNLFENLSVNSLKGDLSNGTTFNPPLLSLVNTFKWLYVHKYSAKITFTPGPSSQFSSVFKENCLAIDKMKTIFMYTLYLFYYFYGPHIYSTVRTDSELCFHKFFMNSVFVR